MADTGKKGILIVDDHPLIRNGLAKTVGQEPDLCICGLAESFDSALASIRKQRPALVVVDISLKESASGLDLVKELKQQYPDLPALVLSMHTEDFYAERALRAGALGYITKDAPIEKLLTAIRRVLNMGIYVSDGMAGRMLSRMSNGRTETSGYTEDLLTDRELEVLNGLGQGLNPRQIAQRWGRSVRTVETHCANIKRKLNLDSARELLQRAIQWVQSNGQKSTLQPGQPGPKDAMAAGQMRQ